MSRKGPWEGLSPSRLPLRARFKERRLGTRQLSYVTTDLEILSGIVFAAQAQKLSGVE